MMPDMAPLRELDEARPAPPPLGESFPAVLAAARQGAEWAWDRLYRALAPGVLGYVRARGAPDPEDLLGEIFLQVVRDLRRFDGDGAAFRAWVFTIAHHRLLDDVRARGRRPATPVGAPPDRVGGDVQDEALRSLTDRSVVELLGTVTDDQQAVLLLRIIGGLTIAEVAAALGKPEGAVKALQRRAVKQLEKRISQGGTPFGPTGA